MPGGRSLFTVPIITGALLLFSLLLGAGAFLSPPVAPPTKIGGRAAAALAAAQKEALQVVLRARKGCGGRRAGEDGPPEEEGAGGGVAVTVSRRSAIASAASASSLLVAAAAAVLDPAGAAAAAGRRSGCADIESCREVGDLEIQKDLEENPRVSLGDGVAYRTVRAGTGGGGGDVVKPNSSVDLTYSVSKPTGRSTRYLYSQGFGYEKIDAGGGRVQSDEGVDGLRVRLGDRDVPVGIERALVGMRRGERRRVELPPNAEVGYETSGWRPVPTTDRGRQALASYKNVVTENRMPAVTIWEVEVQRIRN